MAKPRLTAKQFAFCEAYLETLNATEAARRAGYQAKTHETFRAIGCENLTKPNIRTYIDQRLADLTMPAEEVLLRLTQQAKGADITDFATMEATYEKDDKGEVYLSGYTLKIDLDKIQESGLGHLIRKISQNNSGITIEWHNPQKALELLGKYHNLFTDKVEVDLSDDMKEHIEHFKKLTGQIYGNE